MPFDRPNSRVLAERVEELERRALSEPTACLALAAELQERAVVEQDAGTEIAALYFAGHAHQGLGDDEAALRSVTRALALARDVGDRNWEARVLGGLAGVHSGYGDQAAAVDCLEQALAIRHELGDRLGAAAAMHNLAVTYEEMGIMPERTRELLRSALEVFGATDRPEWRVGSLVHLASLDTAHAESLARTDPATARTHARGAVVVLRDALDVIRGMGHPARTGEVLLRYSRALVAAGDVVGARAAVQEAADLPAVHEALALRLMLATVQARVAQADGDLDGAVATLEDGLTAAAGRRRPLERVELLDLLVHVHEERGDLAAALATYRRLHQHVLEQRDVVADVRARALSDRLALERARVDAERARLQAEQLEQVNAELAYEATHDGLTGLANRRAFDSTLAVRTADPADDVALVLADLDNFKEVNDLHSHLVGDEVLRVVARLIGGAVRGTDVVARIGGEEVAVVLDRPHGVDVASVCERIGDAVRKYDWSTIARGLVVTVSIGAAVRRPGESADSLVARADRMLYAAKRAGRDRVELDLSVAAPPVS